MSGAVPVLRRGLGDPGGYLGDRLGRGGRAAIILGGIVLCAAGAGAAGLGELRGPAAEALVLVARWPSC